MKLKRIDYLEENLLNMAHSNTSSDTSKEKLPLVSVIVMAYKRTEFVINALNSVLRQSLPRALYEIIVVKSFWNSEIDGYIDKNGVISIHVGECTVGEMMREALLCARAPIISFLDDDDLFCSSKLARVLEVFSTVDEVVYFRNGLQELVVDTNDVQVSGKKNSKIVILDSKKALKANNRIRMNMSCISVRSSVLRDELDTIRKIVSAQDIAIFYLAVAKGRLIAREHQILTRYRIHGTSAMHSGDKGEFQKELKTLGALESRHFPAQLNRDIKRTRVRLLILSQLETGKINAISSLHILNEFLTLFPRTRKDILAIMLLVTCIVDPRFGTRIFSFAKKLQRKHLN